MLAAFIVEEGNEFTIASVATGTKSVPKSCMNLEGFVLNDCHAEVLARRSFLRYLYSQLELA